jgi:adiponectin receptor
MRSQSKDTSPGSQKAAAGQKHDPSNSNPLAHYEHLPEWRKENPYILTNYRSARNSYRQSIRSLTYLHNETGNIYTHLLFLTLVLLLISCNIPQLGGLDSWFPAPRREDILAISAFLGGVVLCMSFSVTYHTFLDHSESVATCGKQLDFAGITCLIWGSLIATLYYTFSCEIELMRMYMLTVCLFISTTQASDY